MCDAKGVHMDAVSLAWFTGLFEGEGCLSGSASRNWTIQIAMTDEDVVRRAHEVIGVGRVYALKPRPNPDGTGYRKPMWRLTIEKRADLVPLVKAMRPMLGARRAARADEFLAWHEATAPLTPRGSPTCGRCGTTRRRLANGFLYCPGCQARYKRESLARRAG